MGGKQGRAESLEAEEPAAAGPVQSAAKRPSNPVNKAVAAVTDRVNIAAGRAIWRAAMAAKKHPNPARILYAKALQAPSPDSLTLSPFDIWESRFPVAACYVYAADRAPDIDVMFEGLRKLLSKYPALGGRVQVERGGAKVVYAQPRARIVVGQVEPDSTEEWRRGQFAEVTIASVACGMPLRHNKSIFEARITPTEGGRMLVSVCTSHGLVDLQSFSQFMSDWGKLCRDKAIDMSVVQERTNLVIDKHKNPEAAAFDHDKVEELGWVDTPFLGWLAQSGVDVLNGEAEPRVFNFSLGDIGHLKKQVQAGRAWKTFQEKGYRLSAHDVITGFLWRTLAQVHPYHADEDWKLCVVVNWRGRTELVSPNFFGNATTTPHLTVKMKAVLEMDMSELALQVRELSSISDDGLKQIIAYQNHLQFGDGSSLNKFINVGAPFITNGCGLYISNFSKFDLYDVDFGTGRPEVVRMPQPPLPGMSFAYNQETGTDIAVVVTLSRSDSSRLEGINCETAEAIIRRAPPILDHPFCSRSVVSSLGVGILKAGAEARGASWKRGEEGNYHFGDVTRGVVSKVQGAVRKSSRSSHNLETAAIAEECCFESDAQAAQPPADSVGALPLAAAGADADGQADTSGPAATAALAAADTKGSATAAA